MRELRNVIERAMVLESGPLIQPGSLILDQLSVSPGADEVVEDEAGIVPLEEMERRLVERAMQAAGNNQTRAAELLGVSRDQLRYRLKKFEK